VTVRQHSTLASQAVDPQSELKKIRGHLFALFESYALPSPQSR